MDINAALLTVIAELRQVVDKHEKETERLNISLNSMTKEVVALNTQLREEQLKNMERS